MLRPSQLALVQRVILFGSVARGESGPDSDIDLLVETDQSEEVAPAVSRIVHMFETSVKVSKYWELLGAVLPLSVKVGARDEWVALHPALIKDGRVLYGPVTDLELKPGAAFVLIYWADVKDSGCRTNLFRSLHGYTSRERRYPGLLETSGGERVGQGALLVPLGTLNSFKALFRRLKVPMRMRVLCEPGV